MRAAVPRFTLPIVLVVVGACVLVGCAELAGRLPFVRRAACARLDAELAPRGAHAQHCTRVSLLGRRVFVDGLEVERGPLYARAASATLSRRRAQMSELDLEIAHGDDVLTVTGLQAQVERRGDGMLSARLRGAPEVCWGARCEVVDLDAEMDVVDDEITATAHGRVGAFDVDASAQVAEGRLSVHARDPRLGELVIEGRRHEDQAHVTLNAQIPSYAQLAQVLAPDFEALAQLEIDGPFSMEMELNGPYEEPSAWEATGGLDLASLRKTARHSVAAQKFAEPFAFTPTVSETAPRILIDPRLPTYVELDALPEHVVKSVLYAEDAGFPHHNGFDVTEIANALRENIEAGSRKRGASTITQQLAKNLWLSTEKSLERKTHEALAAIALEALLDKDRILEIYINSIQWGPDFYGLVAASQHYFGKPPAELTPKEAAFIASVIPSPKRYHQYCQTGLLSEYFEERVMRLVGLLRDREVISQEEYEVAASTQLEFAAPTPPALEQPSTVSSALVP